MREAAAALTYVISRPRNKPLWSTLAPFPVTNLLLIFRKRIPKRINVLLPPQAFDGDVF